jgi:hypothetical protein
MTDFCKSSKREITLPQGSHIKLRVAFIGEHESDVSLVSGEKAFLHVVSFAEGLPFWRKLVDLPKLSAFLYAN